MRLAPNFARVASTDTACSVYAGAFTFAHPPVNANGDKLTGCSGSAGAGRRSQGVTARHNNDSKTSRDTASMPNFFFLFFVLGLVFYENRKEKGRNGEDNKDNKMNRKWKRKKEMEK